MLVFLNGQFVPEAEATVSVFDRSFLYGDGLFETMLIANGKPFRWAQHLDRLERGAEFLGIKVPFAREALGGFAAELIARNQMPEALLRLTLSRGVGVRGYSPKGANKSAMVMTLHPVGTPNSDSASSQPADSEIGAPLRWRARTANFHLPANEPLAQFKTCNKLAQILARAEAEAAGADEALLLNTDGFVVEGASSNLFWIERGTVCTPPLASGILAGVTREVVRELCNRLQLPCREATVRPAELAGADAVFLSLSSHGIVALSEIDGTALKSSPVVDQLHQAYLAQVRAECG
jgi:branched-chain amino acid aminotransferase